MKQKFILPVLLLFLSNLFLNGQTNVVWSEDFEGEWYNDWYASNGTWEVGLPTSGPGNAYTGDNCAATNLDGFYTSTIETQFVSPYITIPDANENPRLQFWHWFIFGESDDGSVQIKELGSDQWVTVSDVFYSSSSGVWTQYILDLSEFSNKTIQIAFLMDANNTIYSGDENAGWYIDDIELVTGEFVFDAKEDWAQGITNWSVTNGTWEVGVPSSGPDTAYSSENCAGTRLTGNYTSTTETRLVSPYLTIPDASENPRLQFWHWFIFGESDDGSVQVKESGSDQWVTVSDVFYSSSSGVWTQYILDLSEFSNKTIQIAFLMDANNTIYSGDENAGWYIDDIELVTGEFLFDTKEDWEQGITNWSVTNGTWEVGVPSSGPDTAYSSENCAGTRLFGNYTSTTETRLVSPYLTIPDASENPRLQFRHWFIFGESDDGSVQVKESGSDQWVTVSDVFYSSSSGVWTKYSIDLTEFSNKTIQIAFLMDANNTIYSGDENAGWFIDDIELVRGDIIFNNPESWECGIGDWYVTNGTFEVGMPVYGPNESPSGLNCIGTNLTGKYTSSTVTRLVSPWIEIPAIEELPRIKFWHWFNFGENDYAKIQIRDTITHEWTDISNNFQNTSSNSWTNYLIDLTGYAEKYVQVAFVFVARNTIYSNDENAGWFIDDIEFMGWPMLPILYAGEDKSICQGESIQIGGDPTATGDDPVYEYLWSPSQGLSASTVANPVASPDITTTYMVTVTNIDGCITPDLVTVSVHPKPIADAGIDTAMCDGNSVQIGGDPAVSGGVGPYTFQWIGENVNNGSVENPVVLPTYSQDYTLTVTDANKCQNSDHVNVLVRPLPTVNAGADQELCLDDTLSIGGDPTAFGATEPYEYLWEPNFNISNLAVANPKVSPPYSTQYRLNVTDASGCENHDTIEVKVNPLPIASAGEDEEVCSGIAVTIGGNPGATQGTSPYSYKWTGEGLDSNTNENPQASPQHTLTYVLKVTDAKGCEDTDDAIVVVNPLPEVDAGSDTSIISGSSLILDPVVSSGTLPYLFSWTPEDGLDDTSLENPLASPVQTETYTLEVTDGKNCSQADQVTISVREIYTEADFISFSFGIPPQTGEAVINKEAHTIDINVQQGTDLSALVASFTLSAGAHAEVNGTVQQSGVTSNDFTDPVSYAVIAEDSTTTMDWVVTVSVGPGTGTISYTDQDPLRVYPNPFEAFATIEFTNPANRECIFRLYDIAGVVQFEKQKITGERIELKRGNLKSGVYILELRGEDIMRSIIIVK